MRKTDRVESGFEFTSRMLCRLETDGYIFRVHNSEMGLFTNLESFREDVRKGEFTRNNPLYERLANLDMEKIDFFFSWSLKKFVCMYLYFDAALGGTKWVIHDNTRLTPAHSLAGSVASGFSDFFSSIFLYARMQMEGIQITPAPLGAEDRFCLVNIDGPGEYFSIRIQTEPCVVPLKNIRSRTDGLCIRKLLYDKELTIAEFFGEDVTSELKKRMLQKTGKEVIKDENTGLCG